MNDEVGGVGVRGNVSMVHYSGGGGYAAQIELLVQALPAGRRPIRVFVIANAPCS